MTMPETYWERRAEFTVIKHELLKRYLGKWLPICSSKFRLVIFIDGFAGRGKHGSGELGSSARAVKILRNHPLIKHFNRVLFFFVELNADNWKNLCTTIQELVPEADADGSQQDYLVLKWKNPETECHIVREDFCVFFDRILEQLEELQNQTGTIVPTLAFIDPYGFKGVKMESIQRFLRLRGAEAIITFMTQELVRWLNSKPHHKALSQFFGLEVDEIATTCDTISNDEEKDERLAELYYRQLCNVATYVLPFKMRKRTGRERYRVWFVTNHPAGFKAMKEVLWSVDPSGEFEYWQGKKEQKLLFCKDAPNLSPLRELIEHKLKCQCYRSGKLKQYVEEKTFFLVKHLTEVLRKLEDENLIKVTNRSRAKTYPDDALIEWLQT
ncbi:MAG: hypothetical protein DRP82_00785 [Planctomycetota bacterium]|nr:MAG: hypothetical protein DRP82_00785 [Planctomycetota bacterium]